VPELRIVDGHALDAHFAHPLPDGVSAGREEVLEPAVDPQQRPLVVLQIDDLGVFGKQAAADDLGPDEQAMLLRAIEDKRYLPLGSDREMESGFQLICGTNRDLRFDIGRGRFREDLLARIKFWSFRLPGLAERTEDIEPNIHFELQSRSAEIDRLRSECATPDGPGEDGTAELAGLVGHHAADDLALFDRVQLAAVVRVCRTSNSLADAGRKLFSESRKQRRAVNDTDRLRKYLQRFGLSWEIISAGHRP